MKNFSTLLNIVLIAFCLSLNVSSTHADGGNKRIAVLPFTNITEDKEKNWVGAGFSETLTTKLARVKSITILEKQQLPNLLKELNFQLSGIVDEKKAVELGKMYGVQVLVLGSFQVMGDMLRVSARFVDIQTGQVLDTAEVTGNMKDIFSLQDEIAFQLTKSIDIVLGEKEKEEIKVNPTESLSAYEWFSKGFEASEDNDKAIGYYTKAIELDDHFAEAYYNRGTTYYLKNNYEQAIRDFDETIELNPKYADAYINRGNAYDANGNYEQALKDYDKAIELIPEDAETYYNRGLAYYNKGNYDQAIKDYDKAVELNPKFAQVYTNRGLAYYHKGNYEQAIKDYDKTIELNPKLAEAYINRGSAYAEKGDDEQAIKDYDKAIELNPEDSETYYNRGATYAEKGDDEQAIKDYDKSIELNPEFAQAYYNRGGVYYNKGNNEKAKEDLKKAADLGLDEAREALKEYFNIKY